MPESDWEDVTSSEWENITPNTDDSWEDIIPAPVTEEPSLAMRAWERINKPLITAPSRVARKIAAPLEEPRLTRTPAAARIEGFVSGAIEGAGDVLSSLTSPLNLATMVATGGAVRGVPGASLITKGLSAPIAAHGALTTLDPNKSFTERAFGVTELAGGLAGIGTKFPTRAPTRKALPPPRHRFEVDPTGGTLDLTAPPGMEETLGPIVELREPTPAKVADLRSKGYVSGGVTPEGFARMVLESEIPQEMRVPTSTLQGGEDISNVAMGGASPRVLDVLGSSLYSGERSSVVAKELLQNSFDEHRISGQTAPIRMLFDFAARNPRTSAKSRSITVRDQGRGLTPDELYTKFTDVGVTGKGGEESASGGFGFAKAAPMLGGDYAKVVSIVDEGGKRIKYTFEGTPAELKDQTIGVPLKKEVVGADVPTGMTVTTYFPENISFHNTEKLVRGMTERSPTVTSNVETLTNYDTSPITRRALDKYLEKGEIDEHSQFLKEYQKQYAKREPEPLQDTVEIPGVKINIHFEPPARGSQAAGYDLNILNKGLFQGSQGKYYASEPVPNVPRSISADIISTVEEGHPDYPFTANREQLNTKVQSAIEDWIEQNIVSGALKSRTAQLQKDYDSIGFLFDNEINEMHYLDEGGRFSHDELNLLQNSPALDIATQRMVDAHKAILKVADTLNWDKKPSERLKKFGLLFQAPDVNSTRLGVHIPSPMQLNDSAILVNLFEHLNLVKDLPDAVDRLASSLFATITHEQAHIPGGGHDTRFAYRHAQLLEALGRRNTNSIMDTLGSAFGDINSGKLNPEILDLLPIYNESRQRPSRVDDSLIGTGISEQRPASTGRGKTKGGKGAIGGKGTTGSLEVQPTSKLRELYNLPPGLMSVDLPFMTSAAFRQASPLAWTKDWFGAWKQAAKSYGSETAYHSLMNDIAQEPLFTANIETKKGMRSFADITGLRMTELGQLSKREETLRSTWAERIPVYGHAVRASNRAYTAFLNDLRRNKFKQLIEQGKAQKNLPLARQIAEFVNDATGRGSLKTKVPFTGGKEVNLEKAASLLSGVLWSPRLMASRIRMLNPSTYTQAAPFVRKQYIKGIATSIGSWWAFAGLAELAGASVVKDPNSSDYGKIRIGNTRIDPGAGFQQYLVLLSRMRPSKFLNIPGLQGTETGIGPVDLAAGLAGTPGGSTTSTRGKVTPFGEGPFPQNRFSLATDFMTNKAHPVTKLAIDMMRASSDEPIMLGDKALQMALPLFTQDLAEILKEDPNVFAIGAPILGSLGFGTQTFEGGDYNEPVYTPLIPGAEDLDVPFSLD